MPLLRYERKGVPESKAIIFSAADNFHGRTLGVVRYDLLQALDKSSLSFSAA